MTELVFFIKFFFDFQKPLIQLIFKMLKPNHFGVEKILWRSDSFRTLYSVIEVNTLFPPFDPAMLSASFYNVTVFQSLKQILLERDLVSHEDEPYVLEIARAYYNCDAFKTTKVVLG